MERTVIHIDEELCNGCGDCIPNCPEGAIQIIDDKARLVSDLLCDGLGACIGHCPQGAITTEKREAEAYDEVKVIKNVLGQGENTVRAHLKHLNDHGQTEFLDTARKYLQEHGIEIDIDPAPQAPQTNAAETADSHVHSHAHAGGCPGSRFREVDHEESTASASDISSPTRPSELRQWPVQLHLIPASGPWFKGKDLLLSADCVAYAMGDFHKDYLQGKALAIACPKLDEDQEIYVEKLRALIDHGGINSIEVMMMQVPCCRGLMYMVEQAMEGAERKIPIKEMIVSVEGEVLQKVGV
jgi:NAD-dependent dihydropyrimidine dehydrogenase PreA subunit